MWLTTNTGWEVGIWDVNVLTADIVIVSHINTILSHTIIMNYESESEVYCLVIR